MTANPEAIQQRYATIERLYSEGQWKQVEAHCEALLVDLPDSPSDPLRQRVILLLGHTRLYGMGDVASARGYYRALLRTEADSTLRQIAEQGQEQCDLAEEQQSRASHAFPPLAGEDPEERLGAGEAFPLSPGTPAAPPAGTVTPTTQAAAPWLESVEVVEEPEQIEVALADPVRREEIEVRALESLPAAGSVLEALRAEEPDAAAVHAHAPEPATAGNPGGFSPEELKVFSRGLLGVVLD